MPEHRRKFSPQFRAEARPLAGSPGGDQVETSDARWFTTGDLPALPIRPPMRLRIGHALTPGPPLPHRLTSAIPRARPRRPPRGRHGAGHHLTRLDADRAAPGVIV